ncbi:MAG: Trm112 family protein [Actinobacteria bacterium]|nr:MAG: Trm112 family protein [Actinomycetota bacterium]
MAVSQELLDILICPNCHGAIVYDEAAQTITCQGTCKYVYPVRDDIPIMLIDEAEKPAS